MTGPCPKIGRQTIGLPLEPIQCFQCLEMTQREIDYMNVISNARSILGRVVVTPHIQAFPSTHCNLTDKREQVVRDTLGIFSDQTAGMCAHWIEISQDTDPPGNIAPVKISQHLLYN